MDYKETLGSGSGTASGSSNTASNQIYDSDEYDNDGTNWSRLAAESSQSGSGAKRKRNWPAKGRYGAAAKRKKTNTPKKRKVGVRKAAGAKKTPAKAKRGLGRTSFVYLNHTEFS